MTYVSFFDKHPQYVVAEPFPFVGIQRDDATLKEFTKEIWEKFDPERDDRLTYIQKFWQALGLSMDGSYKSFWEFEKWCWVEAKKWREANPTRIRLPSNVILRVPKSTNTNSEWPNTREILSLARDAAIYHAFCVLAESKLTGRWSAWKGGKTEIDRGYPIVRINNSPRLRSIDGLRGICAYFNQITIGFSSSTIDVDYGGLTLSAHALIERASGIDLPDVGAPHEKRKFR